MATRAGGLRDTLRECEWELEPEDFPAPTGAEREAPALMLFFMLSAEGWLSAR